MSLYRLCALTGEMVSVAPKLARTPVSLKPVHLHVTYIHTPPVSIFKEYEVPLAYEGFEETLPFVERLRQLPHLLGGMQAVLNILHETLSCAPMLAMFDSVVSQNLPPVKPDSEWSGKSLVTRVYRRSGRSTEVQERPRRILGTAYFTEHPETQEEVLLWIAPPRMKRAMSLREWCAYIMGRDIYVDRDIREFLKYISYISLVEE